VNDLELTNTQILAIVNPTPDQLAEHREMAASLEMDRELVRQQQVAA
jgi:hypothetical protein